MKEEKTCSLCKRTLSDDKFPSTHHLSYCYECLATRQREYRKKKAKSYWVTKDRKHTLKKRYGLSLEDFWAMVIYQNGKCAICGCDPEDTTGVVQHRKLHVDHDHKTKKVRGLLCNGCNRAIGLLNENPESAKNLAHYLKKHASGNGILDEAKKLSQDIRKERYGHPTFDFARVVGMVNSLLAHKLKEPLEVTDWPLIMQCVKMSREVNSPKRDNRVDGAGYWNTLQMIHDEKGEGEEGS